MHILANKAHIKIILYHESQISYITFCIGMYEVAEERKNNNRIF